MRGRSVLFAAGAIVAAAGLGALAGLSRPDPACEQPADPWGPLTISRAADMVHLREDVSRAKAAASAFADAVATRPVVSDSIDAQEGARTAPARARAWCEATLAEQIASDHQLPVDVVRAQFGSAAPETAAASSISTSGSAVSRPSR
jgi:hypothetical protein